MRSLLALALALALSLVLALGSAAAADDAYGSPSESGLVGKTHVTAVTMYDGTNEGATEVDAFYIVTGGNGPLTKQLRIKGRAGANEYLSALFDGGSLYVVNARFGPNEAHCCPSHLDVQKFHMSDAGGTPSLAGGIYAIVPLPAYPAKSTPAAVAAYDREYRHRITTATYGP